MSEILFLAHRLPFPPDRGDKIRSHHVLKALARLAPVHVGCLAETAADGQNRGELARVAATWCMPRRDIPLLLAGVEAMCRRQPVSLAAFRNGELTRWVRETLAAGKIDTIYAFSGQMGQYVPEDWNGRLIVDLVDVDSAKFEALSEAAAWPMSWVHEREGRLLRQEEARLAARADHVLLISEAEAALFRSRLPEGSDVRVAMLGNGIDAARFDPARTPAQIELERNPGPKIVFTGQMDYAPNEDATLWFIREMLPQIRERHPSVSFHVVGRAPGTALTTHDGRDGCRIWGEVPDTRPFLASADLVVAPLRIARGVQNKVLEAMAMARPVLLTHEAATGIPARDGEHFAVADSAGTLARKANALLEDPAAMRAMGQSARRFVLEEMNWDSALAALPGLLGCNPSEPGQRDAA